MEGHIFSSLLMKQGKGLSISDFQFPLLALLISGGHTELVLTKEWLSYELIGQTRDDAVGEAFDKIARMMELPYPGGPEISKLAEEARGQELKRKSVTLPRPMIRSGDCDFSFSGLKTAVLYKLRNYDLTSKVKKEFAREFEDAVVEILFAKSEKAIEQHGVKTLILGGGVSANTHIRRVFTEEIEKKHPHVALFIPPRELTTDNAIMIGIAGYFRFMNKKTTHEPSAQGNLKLAT
jgi:N6-L-threonylcarbamoyladenine synthase